MTRVLRFLRSLLAKASGIEALDRRMAKLEASQRLVLQGQMVLLEVSRGHNELWSASLAAAQLPAPCDTVAAARKLH